MSVDWIKQLTAAYGRMAGKQVWPLISSHLLSFTFFHALTDAGATSASPLCGEDDGVAPLRLHRVLLQAEAGTARHQHRPQFPGPPSCVALLRASDVGRQGIHIMERGSKNAIKSYPYTQISNWSPAENAFTIIVGSLVKPLRYVFETVRSSFVRCACSALICNLAGRSRAYERAVPGVRRRTRDAAAAGEEGQLQHGHPWQVLLN